jgi:hypothetical protein
MDGTQGDMLCNGSEEDGMLRVSVRKMKATDCGDEDGDCDR